MPVGWCESIPFDRLRKWKRNVSEASPLLWPILISMILTQIIWVGLYQCKDKHNDAEDAITLKGCPPLVAIIVVIIVVCLAVEWFATKFKKVKEVVYTCFVLTYTFSCTAIVVLDATKLHIDIDLSLKLWIAYFCAAVYVFGAILALRTDVFPANTSQYYGVTACVFISVYYLTFLPVGTFWTIATAIYIFFFIGGNIRERVGKGPGHDLQKPDPIETKEMDAQIRRLLIYEIKAPQKPDGYALGQMEKGRADPRSSKYYVEAGEISYSEFVAYAILVGQAMASGIIPCILSALGVIIGVVCSVNIRSRHEIECSFPYSVIFGYCGHYGTLIVQYAVFYLLKATA